MNTAIVLLTTLLQSGLLASVPDLCTYPLTDATGDPVSDAGGTVLSRFCVWTGPSAPGWAGEVCCDLDGDTASCVGLSPSGRCELGERTYCEHAEESVDGSVVCYQSFASACDFQSCGEGDIDAPELEPEDLLCCENGDCYEWDGEYLEDCMGYFSWCSAGYLKEDGTVDCYD